MLVKCQKCGTEASSKCPVLRNIFASPENEAENNFWFGLGFKLEDVPEETGWKPGTKRLKVTMISGPEVSEEEALKDFIRRFQTIPMDRLDRYVCKHHYEHTEDCRYCSFQMEASA